MNQFIWLKYNKIFKTYLKEQHKRNPLVVTVINSFVVIVAKTTLSHFGASMFAMLPRHRESISYPAVRINDVNGNTSVINARNRITCLSIYCNSPGDILICSPELTDQIVCRHNNAAQKQYRTGYSVMTPKYHVVYNCFVNQITNLNKASQSRHQTKHRHGTVLLFRFSAMKQRNWLT